MNPTTKHISLTRFLVCLLVISFFIIGCEEDGNSPFSSETEFYKNAQLTNIYNNEISVLASKFKTEAELLEQRVKAFQANTTSENLIAAQNQWKAVQLEWKQLELYDLGAVANSFIAFEINRWPTDVSRIEENINGDESLNEDFIASIGSSSKGIAAIEYLLFDIQDQILNSSSTYAVRSKQYLVALVENLTTKSFDLQTLWKTNEAAFIASLENGISGSQNQVINAMVTLIEEIIISKLGNPLGDSNGGTIEIERLEAYRGEFSKEIVQQHLTALKRCYDGDFAQTPFRVGFDDFLILIGNEAFSEKIADQFTACQSTLDKIEGSFEEELASNPEAIVAVKNAFRDLLVLIKVDMANVLGSTITFNDNDGD